MDIQIYFFVITLLSFYSITSATVTCEIRDRNDCRYTVICEGHPGNAYTPECDYDPYVTFIITQSQVDSLTTGFFGSTNFDSRVRVIKAIENTWKNLEPLCLRYYSKCLEVDLSGNDIENIKNEAFRTLIALQYLNISHNSIENLNPKSFMFSESKLSDLEVLDLSYNLLTEISGEVLSYVMDLNKLYLQHNKLTTITEDAFSSNKNLTILNLSYNRITALNMTLINLKALKQFDVSNNLLFQISGYEVNRLDALKILNMSHNTIETIESNSFNRAFNLLIVDLSYNRIKSPIESVMFINNNKLAYLDLYQNDITQIQDNAFKHNELQHLYLQRNNLAGDITENTFLGLQYITTLNLSNQNISGIKKNAFSDVVNLVYLNLSLNNIKIIENSSFSGAPKLSILDVSNNNVSSINFLRNSLANLTELYLKNNSLVEIPRNAFDNQTLLKKLDISLNAIKTIAPGSLPLNNLQYLIVNDNSMFGVLSSNIFSPAKFLRYLDLSKYKYTHIEKMALVDLPLLARMNLSYNELEYIDPNNFVGMNNMYNLDLSHNKLSCFHLSNSSLINLKALYLNNNKLSNISQTFVNMTGLLYIDLSNNNITELSDAFSTLVNLQQLHLAKNKIYFFNYPQINSLSNLTTLDLSGNQLTQIDLSFFKNLVMVDLSFNQLSYFNSSFFKNLDYLQSLDISGNNISQINPGTFQNVKILKLLNLSHNKLTNLRYGSFRGLNRTEFLDLSYNEINDIDVDVLHECAELRRLIIDYNYLKTFDVERLIITLPKLTSLSLGGNPLSCKEIVRNIKTINKNLIRQVEVTSIDKVFHEDNVHGIRCGVPNITSTTEKLLPEASQGDSTTLILAIWCSVLTVVVLLAIGIVYIYKKNRMVSYTNTESRLQLRNSLSEFNNSETQHDLLG